MVMKTFQIFRAGTFTSMGGKTLSFSESDIALIATSYSEARKPANLVIGHPNNDLPAYGTVKKLFDKGGKLYAIADVGQSLIDMVKTGAYQKISAAFIPIARSGDWYLRHVGFLGAMAPAVKGMDSLKFAESANGDFCFSEPGSVCFPVATVEFGESGDEPGRLAFHHAALALQKRTGMSYGDAAHTIDARSKAKRDAAMEHEVIYERAAFHAAALSFMQAVTDASYSDAVIQLEAAGMRL